MSTTTENLPPVCSSWIVGEHTAKAAVAEYRREQAASGNLVNGEYVNDFVTVDAPDEIKTGEGLDELDDLLGRGIRPWWMAMDVWTIIRHKPIALVVPYGEDRFYVAAYGW